MFVTEIVSESLKQIEPDRGGWPTANLLSVLHRAIGSHPLRLRRRRKQSAYKAVTRKTPHQSQSDRPIDQRCQER